MRTVPMASSTRPATRPGRSRVAAAMVGLVALAAAACGTASHQAAPPRTTTTGMTNAKPGSTASPDTTTVTASSCSVPGRAVPHCVHRHHRRRPGVATRLRPGGRIQARRDAARGRPVDGRQRHPLWALARREPRHPQADLGLRPAPRHPAGARRRLGEGQQAGARRRGRRARRLRFRHREPRLHVGHPRPSRLPEPAQRARTGRDLDPRQRGATGSIPPASGRSGTRPAATWWRCSQPCRPVRARAAIVSPRWSAGPVR